MMGLMWYDATDRDLAEKIRRAAQRYKQKFGETPNICHVHPSEITTDSPGMVAAQILIEEVEVVPSSRTLPHHFLIGRKENLEQ